MAATEPSSQMSSPDCPAISQSKMNILEKKHDKLGLRYLTIHTMQQKSVLFSDSQAVPYPRRNQELDWGLLCRRSL